MRNYPSDWTSSQSYSPSREFSSTLPFIIFPSSIKGQVHKYIILRFFNLIQSTQRFQELASYIKRDRLRSSAATSTSPCHVVFECPVTQVSSGTENGVEFWVRTTRRTIHLAGHWGCGSPSPQSVVSKRCCWSTKKINISIQRCIHPRIYHHTCVVIQQQAGSNTTPEIYLFK